MSVTLSCDHRAVDGALGAELIGAFKALIENPVMMWCDVCSVGTAHVERHTRNVLSSAAQRQRWQMTEPPSTSSSSAPAPAAMSPPSAPRSSASRPRSSSSDYLGGICLNWGCIPTKALLRSAEIYPLHAARQGLRPVGRERLVRPEGRGRSARAASSKRLNDGVGFLMKKNKVTVIWGEATHRRARQVHGEGVGRPKRRRARSGRAAIRPSTSSSPPARGRACCRVSSRTRSWSGPISRR